MALGTFAGCAHKISGRLLRFDHGTRTIDEKGGNYERKRDNYSQEHGTK
jgi:hypothetical protein